ncbi:hypothetical protein EDEG_01517 [Edhazardia aedis USNM 41457]|uniref:Uncharacterized protein n=1 Tax=Edhazardia aedis (strain USNM 41457) TaxID=1003232 RepID=J9DNR9_EDHAE|nr:hypothetical protein EDEG_01517 [Edhazardia aedis USNM 41457]|eukprot:EJW04185.1 hypothetical protein EDEG_01517 [Edhazardia aedis USNM 41457]
MFLFLNLGILFVLNIFKRFRDDKNTEKTVLKSLEEYNQNITIQCRINEFYMERYLNCDKCNHSDNYFDDNLYTCLKCKPKTVNSEDLLNSEYVCGIKELSYTNKKSNRPVSEFSRIKIINFIVMHLLKIEVLDITTDYGFYLPNKSTWYIYWFDLFIEDMVNRQKEIEKRKSSKTVLDDNFMKCSMKNHLNVIYYYTKELYANKTIKMQKYEFFSLFKKCLSLTFIYYDLDFKDFYIKINDFLSEKRNRLELKLNEEKKTRIPLKPKFRKQKNISKALACKNNRMNFFYNPQNRKPIAENNIACYKRLQTKGDKTIIKKNTSRKSRFEKDSKSIKKLKTDIRSEYLINLCHDLFKHLRNGTIKVFLLNPKNLHQTKTINKKKYHDIILRKVTVDLFFDIRNDRFF